MVRVIYISYTRLTEKTNRDWYIEALLVRNVHVEYWDVVSLVRKDYMEATEIERPYKKIFSNYDQLQKELGRQNPADTLYVMLLGYEYRSVKLYRLLSTAQAKMAFFFWGVLPANREPMWRRVFRKAFNPVDFFKSAWGRVWCALNRKSGWVVPYEVLFKVGELGSVSPTVARKVIAVNLSDYESYRYAQTIQRITPTDPYAVFLDINLANQSDLTLTNSRAVNEKEYIAALNTFFDKIEIDLKLKVVIAAHPKAMYSPKYFNGREIYYDATPNLVPGANLILSHHSTSVSYAVICQKPIIFFYNGSMINGLNRKAIRNIQEMADYLGCPCVNSNDLVGEAVISLPAVNRDLYDGYKYSYVVSRVSENSSNEDIFIAAIAELFGLPDL